MQNLNRNNFLKTVLAERTKLIEEEILDSWAGGGGEHMDFSCPFSPFNNLLVLL